MAEAAPRISFEGEKEGIIKELAGKEGAFSEIRQVLAFAGAIGFSQDARIPLANRKGEAIRWDTFIGIPGVSSLIQMVALVSSEDREIVDPRRLSEQLSIFEEYVNGGLTYLKDLVENSTKLPREVILDLTKGADESSSSETDDPLGIRLDNITREK